MKALSKSLSRNFLNSFANPFGLVVLLTLVVFVGVFFQMDDPGQGIGQKTVAILGFWHQGFFSLVGFTLQMIMILVFGFSLAVYKPINSMLKGLAKIPNDLSSGVVLVATLTMVAGLLNWGFGLIIGALLARFVQESLSEKGKFSNPALLAATGYLGMGIWHGGFSGSAPLTVSGSDHFLLEKTGVIPVSDTLFSSFNIQITGGLFLVYLVSAWLMSNRAKSATERPLAIPMNPIAAGDGPHLARVVGAFMLLVILVGIVWGGEEGLSMISLNWVNFLLFSLTLVAFGSWDRFIFSVGEGLKASTDILVQFPFYAGILGLLSASGVILKLSLYIQSQTGPELFPFLSFFSSAFVNLLIPSGGGQWAIQGPILMETASKWNLDYGKLVMVFSYGDQVSNLLQPFWALPLLSITGVSVRKLFPYCFVLFLVGFLFLTLGIWLLF